MSNEFSEALDALGERFGIVIDWTQQNIQPYVQDLMQRVVQYNLVVNIIISAISLTIFILGVYWVFKNVNNALSNSDDNAISEVKCILGIICSVFCFIILAKTIPTIIRCCYLPEVVFIKELQQLLK